MLRIIEETSEGKGFALGSSLDDLAHEGARRMLVSALEAEVGEYVERYRSERDEAGRFACPHPGAPAGFAPQAFQLRAYSAHPGSPLRGSLGCAGVAALGGGYLDNSE